MITICSTPISGCGATAGGIACDNDSLGFRDNTPKSRLVATGTAREQRAMQQQDPPESPTRRAAVATLLASGLALAQDAADPNAPPLRRRLPGDDDEPRLPDGRSQDNAIARKEHEDALKDANELVALAEQIRDAVEKAGNYVVPVSALKKTEDIEKLARKIRSRLKS